MPRSKSESEVPTDQEHLPQSTGKQTKRAGEVGRHLGCFAPGRKPLSGQLFLHVFRGMKFVEHDSPCCVDLHLFSRVFPVLGDGSRLAARNIIMMKQHCWPARDGSPLSTSESWWRAFHPPKLFEPSKTHKQTMTRRWENIGWEGLSLKRLG